MLSVDIQIEHQAGKDEKAADEVAHGELPGEHHVKQQACKYLSDKEG